MKTYKKDRPCIKCGHTQTSDKFQAKTNQVRHHDALDRSEPITIYSDEKILRECLNCHFIWAEKPLRQGRAEDD